MPSVKSEPIRPSLTRSSKGEYKGSLGPVVLGLNRSFQGGNCRNSRSSVGGD